MIQINLVLIFSFSLLRRQIATAAQEQPSSIVTWTNMGWQHDAILGPYRTSGFWMPKWVSWPFGSILANSVWVPCGPPTKSPLGHPHGATCGPMDCPCGVQMGPCWGPDGSHVSRLYGPLVAPLANSVRVPCGPPIEGPLGHPHGAHLWPVWTVRVEPRWVHGGAQMGPTCIARMGPLWPPWPILRGPRMGCP